MSQFHVVQDFYEFPNFNWSLIGVQLVFNQSLIRVEHDFN